MASDTGILLATGARDKLEVGGRAWCMHKHCAIPKGQPRIRSDSRGTLCESCATSLFLAKRVPYVGVNPDPAAVVQLGSLKMTTRIDPEDGIERPCVVFDLEDDGASLDLVTGKGDLVRLNLFDFTRSEHISTEAQPQVVGVDVIPMQPDLHNTVIIFSNPNIPTGKGTPKMEAEHDRIYAEFEGQSGESVAGTIVRRVRYGTMTQTRCPACDGQIFDLAGLPPGQYRCKRCGTVVVGTTGQRA